jgi:hypothetical protein
MDATKSNSKLVSDILNKLPAAAPIGIGAAGVAQLPEQKYGGWLEEYQDGGVRRPIYTSNPNDPRIRSYRDSLNLYNEQNRLNILNNKTNYPQELANFPPIIKNNLRYTGDPNKGGYVNPKIFSSNIPTLSKDIHGNLKQQYKKPVQPVIYKKPTVPKVYKKLESTPKVVKASIPVPTSTPIIENVLPVPVVEPSKPSLVATNIDLDMYPTGTGMASDYRYGVVLEDGTRKLFNTKKEYDEWKALNNLDISKAQINQGKGYTTMYYPENKKYGGLLTKYQNGGDIETEDDDDIEMVEGIADILRQVKDKDNRKQIAKKMVEDFEEEDVDYNLDNFLKASRLMQMGGMSIPGVNGTVIASTASLYKKHKARRK